MPENIINLDAHRNKDKETSDPTEVMERMSLIEDMIEQMDELGVTTREELVELLDTLESSTPETLE
jgi:hypothetical protein